MADDRDSSTVNRLKELARKFETRRDIPTAPESDLITRLGAIIEKQQTISSQPNMDKEAYASLEEKKLQTEARIDTFEERRMRVASQQFTSGIITATSTANLMRDVNAASGSTGSLAKAARYVNTPTYELESMRAQASAKMVRLGARIAEQAENDEDVGRLTPLIGQLGTQVNNTATAQAAIDLQRRQGLDIESRYLGTRKTQGRLEGILESKGLTNRVAAGEMGSRAEVEDQFRKSVEQVSRFREAQHRHADDPVKFERFQKAIDKLTGSAEKAADTLREMERQGRGMGGVSDFFSSRKVQGGLQIVQAAANLGASVLDTWTFQNPLRQRQNETAFANLANRQFDDTLNALSGDMGALRRLGSSYGAAADVGNTAKTGSKASTGLQTLGSIAGVGLALAGGVTTATGIGAGLGVPMMMAGIGIAGAANTMAGNWNQQAGERSATISQAEITRRDALSKIDDVTAQSYVNLTRGLAGATVGLGGGFGGRASAGGMLRNAAFEQMQSRQMLQRLAEVGITPEQSVGMTAAGIQQLGREFNPNMLVRAGQFRQAGIMGEQQTIQSLGALSMVGGNAAGNLEEILKNAVANGMDNAKSIAQMVEATTSLASKSAAAGIDVTSGSAAAVGKIMDQLEEQNVPINARGGVTQNSLQFANETLSSKSLNLNNIAEWQQFSKLLPGASGAQLRKLSTFRAEEFEQLRGPNGAAFAKQVGIGSLVLNDQGQVDPDKMKAFQQIEFTKLVNTVLPRGLNEGARGAALSAGSFEEFKKTARPKEMEDFLAIASEKGINLGATLGIADAGRPRTAAIPTKTEGAAGEVDRQRQAEAQGQGKVLEQGREIIDALGGLKGLTVALEGIAKNFDPKEMSKGVKDAANNFNLPVQKFSEAVDKFATALDKTSKK